VNQLLPISNLAATHQSLRHSSVTNLNKNDINSTKTVQKKQQWKVWLTQFSASLFWVLLATVSALPGLSAERISFSYGIFGEFYISVEDLEMFAQQGKITPRFAYYARRVSPEDLAKLRNLLNQRFQVNQVLISNFLNLPIGKRLSEEIGLIIDCPPRISQPALRAALVLAAATKPGELTILDVIRQYNQETLKLNTHRISEAINEATKLFADTERVFNKLELVAQTQATTTNSPNPNPLQDLEQLGQEKWQKESLLIKQANEHSIEAVVYLPQAKKPASLIVIAPGLGTDLENFTYLAKHLASYGFGVALVNFPGSNSQRIASVLSGMDTPPKDNQWVEQPKIVTWLLDEIERKSTIEPSWQGKLDLQKVGVIGQSLGGYTAMALAGAKVNWSNLLQECKNQVNSEQINFNLSLLWQCQSQTFSLPATDLQDKRVVAAIAINPLTNPVFGQSGISQLSTPLMIVTGDDDLFTPALAEQIKPFTWVKNANKYLVLVKNSTHFSFIGEGKSNEIKLPSPIVGPNPALARSYLKVLSLAFFQTHLAEKSEFTAYLNESYVNGISKQLLPITLVRSLTNAQLEQMLEKNR
jgi:predicted dienelactone hydrolase